MDRATALQRVTDPGLALLSTERLLTELLDRIVEVLATDTAAFLLLEEGGKTLLARAAKGIEEEVEQRVRVPVGRGFAGRVAAQRRAIFIPDIDKFDIYNPILRQKGIRSLLGVPLIVEGRVIGVLHVGTLVPRVFTDEDRELLQIVGDRAAMSIEHAQLYERERELRFAAEATTQRLQALQRVTDAALAYLPLDELLLELLDRIAEILHSDTAAFLLLDEGSDQLVARAAKGIEEEVEQGVRIPVGRGFAGRIAAERRAVFIPDVDHADILNPILSEKGIRSLLGVPLLIEGRVIGVLHVGSLVERNFDANDRDLLQLAADRAATAIEHARLFHQRQIVEEVQRTLVSEAVPHVPGLELAGRYQPAESGGIGGDWYDVFSLPSGQVALVIGDVMGHGIGAAAVMAQVRTGARAFAVDGHPPSEVVERLNRLVISLSPSRMTTLLYAVVDFEAERLTLVSAGHLPPLLRAPGGSTELIEINGDPPLGVFANASFHEHAATLPPESTVVLVTDGAVESRGESVDRGLERLRKLLDADERLEDACSAIAQGAARGAPGRDDVAVLAARVAPLEERLITSWPADRNVLGAMRPLLRRWLRKWDASPDDVYDITVAVQEASANAIEHAYAPGRATFDVEARHEDGAITVIVRDHGRWRPPRGAHRGRGLLMMRALMESVDVDQSTDGTTVVLRRTLGKVAA